MTSLDARPLGSPRLGVIALIVAAVPLLLAGLTGVLYWLALGSDLVGALYSTVFIATAFISVPLCIAAVVLGAVSLGRRRSRVLGLVAIIVAIVGFVGLVVWFLSELSKIGH